MCSVCDSVGRTVASDIRDPLFKSSLRQMLFTINRIEKTKIKKKRPGMSLFKKMIRLKSNNVSGKFNDRRVQCVQVKSPT